MEENKTCSSCRYFRQHYVRLARNRFDPIPCGHCGEPRLREKKPDTPACSRYAQKKAASGGPLAQR